MFMRFKPALRLAKNTLCPFPHAWRGGGDDASPAAGLQLAARRSRLGRQRAAHTSAMNPTGEIKELSLFIMTCFSNTLYVGMYCRIFS